MTSRSITECRACGAQPAPPFLSLGEMPPANNLPVTKNEHEQRYPLELAVCPSCYLVQLCHVVDPEVLFGQYLYSSSSGLLGDHFAEMASRIVEAFELGEDAVAVDIGSNDGLLLRQFMEHGVPGVVGVEPAANMAAAANRDAIPTIHAFFSETVVDAILRDHGPADVVTAANVFAHVDDIRDLASGVARLLKPRGVFVVEVPYLPVMLRAGTFDLVYHEHLSYFSLTPMARFFETVGMEVFRVEHVPTHGGSIRVFVQRNGAGHAGDGSVGEMVAEEGPLRDLETYAAFGRGVAEMVAGFADRVRALKKQGRSLAGYAAPAKASTLLGYARLDDAVLDYIVDDNPLKQGRFVPGTRIPVVSSATLDENPSDYMVILAWNLAEAIIPRLEKHRKRGMKFIVPFAQDEAAHG